LAAYIAEDHVPRPFPCRGVLDDLVNYILSLKANRWRRQTSIKTGRHSVAISRMSRANDRPPSYSPVMRREG